MGKTRIAVIGSGYWGKNLVRNFAALGVLSKICERDEKLLQAFAEQYPETNTCLAFSEVLKDQDIAGLAIATPAESHFVLAREGLLAGKHVYVEKPLTLDLEQARELIDLAAARGLVLMVGHLLQYHPVFVQLKKMVQSGELGRIEYVYSNRLNLGKIRREENILWSFAPHDISMILSLAGEMPDRVCCLGSYYLHQKIADVTTTHLSFSSGLNAHVFVSWLHPFKEQKLVVVGDKKMAVFDDTRPWGEKLLLYPHEIKWKHNMPVPNKAEAEVVKVKEDEPLRRECQHFLECIEQGLSPRTDGREGLRVLTVLKLSQTSLDKGGEVLNVSNHLGREQGGGQPSEGLESKAREFFVHDTALLDPGVQVGTGCKIWHFSHILTGTKMGPNCNIGQNVMIGPEVTVGQGCKIQNNVSIYKGVTLEDDVFCGPSMVFTNVYNPRAHIARMDELRPTLVKKGATLGANCTIVCGNQIGRYALIGAGAVVIADVPDHALMVGNPARQVGWVCACGNRLDEQLSCPLCKQVYRQGPAGLELS